MKVSETSCVKQNGSGKQPSPICGEVVVVENRNNSLNPVKPAGRMLKVNNSVCMQNAVTSTKGKAVDAKGEGGCPIRKEKATKPNAKKPWIPCTRRPSKPKPPPAIIEMELALLDPEKICKKYPKSPSPDSSGGDKCCNKTPKKPLTTTNKAERRTKVILKRQFALDKKSNSKESISDESLTSITSVTQLLKIERSSYVISKSKATIADDDEEDEIFTGVKFLAAKLQARNANSDFSTTTRSSRGGNCNGKGEENKNANRGMTKDDSIPKTRSSPAEPSKLDRLEEKVPATAEPQKSVPSATAKTVSKSGAPAAASSPERKLVDSKESSFASVSSKAAATVGQQANKAIEKKLTTSASSASPPKSKDRSNPQVKKLLATSVKTLSTPTWWTTSNSDSRKAPHQSHANASKRPTVVRAPLLAQQSNQIKDHNVSSSGTTISRSDSSLSSLQQSSDTTEGSGQTKRSPGAGHHSGVVLKSGDNPITKKKSSFKCKEESKGKCGPSDSQKTGQKVKQRRAELTEESSLSSSSSSTSLSWKSGQRRRPQIVPSIIMSEYVESGEDGRGGRVVVTKSQSLFTPLQFIEPLEPTCDILEGSCLELKVRVRGAETVVWVKEDKIVPNAPPDFQYFEDRTNGVFGLRISDAFLEDSGLYVCEAYGAENKEITCWCQVDVLAGTTDDDDISWEDLDMAEDIQTPQPLVVPVIVTSQAEQDSEPSPGLEITKPKDTKEPSPVNQVTIQEMDTNESHSEGDDMLEEVTSSQVCGVSSDEGVSETSTVFRNDQVSVECSKTTHSPREATTGYAEDTSTERVTDFASARALKQTHYSIPEEMQSEPVSTTSVAVVVPAEVEHLTIDADTSTGRPLQDVEPVDSEQRKFMSQLSSASDESISLKEIRSGDEAEENSASAVVIDVETKADAEGGDVSPSESPASSPFSEQNGRSSSVDSAIGFLNRPLFSDGKFPPRILMGPSCVVALYGEVVHLRIKVQNYGIPKTTVNWFKFINGTYKKIELNSGDLVSSQSDAHISITKCGTSLSTLSITQINYDDCGRYRVKVQNALGMDSHDCVLTVEGPPEPPKTPPKVKYDEKCKTILIQWSSCPYDGGCKITGYYVEASIVQGSRTAVNKEDQDNWQLLTPQSYSWLCYTLTNPKRGSVYRFRVFGENSYGRGKPTDPSLPLLVPVLMEGRRAGSSDALLWSLKTIPQVSEETSSHLGDSIVPEHANEGTHLEESASSQEEEPIEYKNVVLKHESFYNVYDKLDELGKGRFGIVFEVVNKESKMSYAGKFVKCIKAKDKERVQLEVKIMNDLEYHPKLICLIDAFEMTREIVIVTQRINGGELFERVVADDFTLTEGDCITFLQQICDAVKYIHSKNIMHLDLKPENILCTAKDSNQIKIIDFGLAQYFNPKYPIRVLFGTAEFVSPEIINYDHIAPSTDNWSVGVITYILLSGLSPFMGDSDHETFSNITRAEFDFDDEAFEKISSEAKDFISNLIVKRPEKRMTAEECLNHRWLRPESDNKKDVVLPTDKLKRFLVRRKWQKTGNAIRALGRITTLYSSRRSSSSSSTPTGSFSSPPQPSFYPENSDLSHQDSSDYDNVFLSRSSSKDDENYKGIAKNNPNILQKPIQLVLKKNETLINHVRPKYSDPCRSDSGVCDVGSFSSSVNSE